VTKNAYQDLIDALQESRKPHDDEGLTLHEIQERIGRGKAWVTERIRSAQKGGCVSVGRRNMAAIDGRMVKVPVYMFKRGKL
jgi:hypothetical protein